MEPLFEPDARKNFIVGITEILLQIFEIDDEATRNNIITELSKLDDRMLLEKKDAIEDHLATVDQINKVYFVKLLHVEHLLLEKEERKGVESLLRFAF
jgi:hypothetical protein